MKGTLNDERNSAKTADSRNRNENYRSPPAHPFKESLCLLVGNTARQRWKIWITTSGSRSTITDYFKMWSNFKTLHSVIAFNELNHSLRQQPHVWLLDHILRHFQKRAWNLCWFNVIQLQLSASRVVFTLCFKHIFSFFFTRMHHGLNTTWRKYIGFQRF